MLTSISPLGERARGNRWSVTVLWLGLGAVAGGAAVGAALGALGQISVGGMWAAMSGSCCWPWPAPARRPGTCRVGGSPAVASVNEDWLVAYRSWVYGAGFGVQLGAGSGDRGQHRPGAAVHGGCVAGR